MTAALAAAAPPPAKSSASPAPAPAPTTAAAPVPPTPAPAPASAPPVPAQAAAAPQDGDADPSAEADAAPLAGQTTGVASLTGAAPAKPGGTVSKTAAKGDGASTTASAAGKTGTASGTAAGASAGGASSQAAADTAGGAGGKAGGDAAPQQAPDAAAFTPAGADPAQPSFASPPTSAAPSAGAAVADPQTITRLVSQIVETAQGPASQFNLTLHPAELGGVQVKIQVDRHGTVSASMTFDNPQAAADLKAHSADLKAALNQAGFDVSDDGLSFNLSGQGQQNAGNSDPDASAWAGRAFRAAASGADDLLTTVNEAASRLQRSSSTGLDIRI
jgi:Meckel syndrome type 1 protein